MRSINLDYLRTFVTVIEQGGFSAAAERLNLTQPAVSLQIRQLEKRLGTRLVERVGRRARPTASGAELLSHAGQIDAAVESALDAVARHADGTLGRVRLGTGATSCIFLLPPMLRTLKTRYPHLEINITIGNTHEIVRAIEENTIDIGLVTLPASGRMLDVAAVLDDELVAIAPPGSRLPDRVTPSVLAALPLLLFEPGANKRRLTDEWFAREGVALRPAMSLGSVEAIKELVGAGLGYAILPHTAVRAPASRHAFEVRSLSPRLHRTLATVIRRDKPLTRGLRETLRALRGLSGEEGRRPAPPTDQK